MVTQLLFGEFYKVLEWKTDWLRLQCATDGYEGWMDGKLHQPVSQESYSRVWTIRPEVLACPFLKIRISGGVTLIVPAGSILPPDALNRVVFEIAGRTYTAGSCRKNTSAALYRPEQVVRQFLHVPYLWGGKSVFGCDCSGLVQTVMRICGTRLPRDAWQQAQVGKPIPFGESRAGDLAFFKNEMGKIIHVGILTGASGIIHASGYVKMDRVDERGIFSIRGNRITHQMAETRRIS
jgi:hypothetical protein